MSLPIIQNTKVGDFQCRLYQSDFVIEYSTLRVLFVDREKKEKACRAKISLRPIGFLLYAYLPER